MNINYILNDLFFKSTYEGYILGISTQYGDEPIPTEEYNKLRAIIAERPTPPEGYTFRLRADTLEWELAELPPEPEPEPEAEAEDYESALEVFGV